MRADLGTRVARQVRKRRASRNVGLLGGEERQIRMGRRLADQPRSEVDREHDQVLNTGCEHVIGRPSATGVVCLTHAAGKVHGETESPNSPVG